MNFEYDSPDSLSPLGKDNGYQHLYLEGKGQALWRDHTIFVVGQRDFLYLDYRYQRG